MSLPTIAPYEMPTEAELVANRVSWTPDPDRAVLLVHDMQQHFLAPYVEGASPLTELIAAVSALRNRAHELGIPVVYSAQPGGQSRTQRGLLQDFWGDGIGTDPRAAAIVDALAPAREDVLLTKWRYSAFVRTELTDLLEARGRDQLIICGVYAHIGCLTTALHAFMQEVQPFVVADATADFSRADHLMALGYAAQRCAVVTTTNRLLEQLPSPAATSDGAAVLLRTRLGELLDDPLADVDDETDLTTAGLDSLRLMGLITEWREAGIAVSFEELIEEPTIGAWSALLDARATAARS
jgi:bifunctional isochorismate lyase/aryl carrier protein